MTLSKLKALERMEGLLKNFYEVREFAQKHNDLRLYQASDADSAAVYEAIEALKESIARDNGQSLPATRTP
jgi:hypothetical protein